MENIGIYGASDDLLEIEGEIREEYGCYGEGKLYVSFSNGAVISVEYDGEWKIMKHSEPEDGCIEIHAAGSDKAEELNSFSGDYSDYAEIKSDQKIEWVAIGNQIYKNSGFSKQNEGDE